MAETVQKNAILNSTESKWGGSAGISASAPF